jgi:HD domain
MNIPTPDEILSYVRTDAARASAALAALTYVSSVEPPYLLHHSIRSYLFAHAFGPEQGLEAGYHYDDGLLFLGCLLHDIGLTDEANGAQRFEVDGADRAAAFVLEHGLSKADAETIWDAIALHTSAGIASCKQPEIALVFAGIAMDVFGFDSDRLPVEIATSIRARYPRLNLETNLANAVLSPSGSATVEGPSVLLRRVTCQRAGRARSRIRLRRDHSNWSLAGQQLMGWHPSTSSLASR